MSAWLVWLWIEAAESARSCEPAITRTLGLWVADSLGDVRRRPARSETVLSLAVLDNTLRKVSPSPVRDDW